MIINLNLCYCLLKVLLLLTDVFNYLKLLMSQYSDLIKREL